MHDHPSRRGQPPAILTDWVEQHRLPVEDHVTGPLRAAIYARRSIADPRFVSISRQVAAAESHCEHIGAVHDPQTLLFIDRHRSGSTMSGRLSLKALLAAANARLFDILAVQGIDRLTRNAADAAIIVGEFERLNIAIHVAGTGPVPSSEVVFKAFQYQKELSGLVDRMQGGYRAAAESGSLVGSYKRYGYDRKPRGAGLTINPLEARVLRRCFESIDSGMTRAELIRQLNDEGIPGPGGGPWTHSNLFHKSGSGQLRNTMIKGVWTWDRNCEKPVEVAVPDLAIVDEALFDRVKTKLEVGGTRTKARPEGIKVLPPMARCVCGAPFNKRGGGTFARGLMACKRPPHHGPCEEKSSIPIVEAERRYLRFVHDEILDPSRLEFWQKSRDLAFGQMLRSAEAERLDLSRRIAEVERQMDEADDDTGHDGWLLAYMGNLETEYHKLWSARDRSEALAPLRIEHAEADRLRGAIARMLPKLPYRVTDSSELAVVSRIHLIVPRMIAEGTKEGYYGIRWLLGVTETPQDPTLPDDQSDRWIVRRYSKLQRGALQVPERIIHWHGLADDRIFAFTDAEWISIHHLFEGVLLPSMEARMFAEALVFLTASRIPASMLPERYAGFNKGRGLLHSYQSIWLEMTAILKSRGSKLPLDVGTQLFVLRRR